MSLASQLENIIQEHVTKFITAINEKYSISQEELQTLWGEITKQQQEQEQEQKQQESKPISNIVVKKPSSPKKESPTKSNSSSSEADNTGGCPYIWARGPKSGQKCGSKPKNGALYCSRHKSKEGIETKPKKVVPTIKKTLSSSLKQKSSPSPSKALGLTLYKNKSIDRLWDPETQMVFKSIEEKKVIGKFVDGEIVSLGDEDIELCKLKCFIIDEILKDDTEEKNASLSQMSEKINKYKPETVSSKDEEKTMNGPVKTSPIKRSPIKRSPVKTSPVKRISEISSSNELKEIKKSIDDAVVTTNLKAKDIEDVLGELFLNVNSDEDEDEEDLTDEDEELVEEE